MIAGDTAPDFVLPSSAGNEIRLYTVLESSSVVLFFYSKTFTPVCTAEVCAFRDEAPSFEQANAAVLGISPDPAALAQRFSKFYHLPFPLLIDTDGRVRKLYGVRSMLGIFPGRVTFVIGRDHLIQRVTQAAFQSTLHIKESLKALQEQ